MKSLLACGAVLAVLLSPCVASVQSTLGGRSNSYFDALCQRPDNLKCESLRSLRDLQSFAGKGIFVSGATGLPTWDYAPNTDTDPQRQDAAKGRLHAFVQSSTPKTLAQALSVPAGGTIEPVTFSSNRGLAPGRAVKIDNEVLACIAPGQKQSCLIAGGVAAYMMRGAYGTAVAAHASGTPVYGNVNSLMDQVVIPIHAAPNVSETYFATIDLFFTDSMKGMGLAASCAGLYDPVNTSSCAQKGGGYKALTFRSPGNKFWETKIDTNPLAVLFPQGMNAATVDVGAPALRLYSVAGPPYTRSNPVVPQTSTTFIHRPGKWTRWHWLFEKNANTNLASFARVTDIAAALAADPADNVVRVDYGQLDAGANVIGVNGNTRGRRIKIDNEMMALQTCAAKGTPRACTVTRAVDGSALATHDSGADFELQWDYGSLWLSDEDHDPVLVLDRVPSVMAAKDGQPQGIASFHIEFNDSQDRVLSHRPAINWIDMIFYAKNFAMLRKSGTGGAGGGRMPTEWVPLLAKPTAGG